MVGSRRLIALTERVLAAVDSAMGNDLPAVVVALSGGADSAVLAWSLIELERPARAVHVHHGWPDSDRMADAARDVAGRVGMTLSTRAVDTSASGSPEAVARQARYEALGDDRTDREVVATAHTRTDQAETLVGNLMWGSGVDGLRAIHRRNDWLVRPLLDVPREEVRELAVLLGLPFVDDPANADVRFRRIRIRRALASWEADLAPGVTDRLASTADLVSEEVALLDRQVAGIAIESEVGAVRIATGIIRSLDPALAARVVRRGLRKLNDGSPGSQADVDVVIAVANGGPPGQITGGHRVERSGAYVQMGGSATPEEPGALRWELPGVAHHGGWSWTAQAFDGVPTVLPMSRWIQVFDASLFDRQPSSLRLLRTDDRIAMRDGRKLARDALAEAGISPDERAGWTSLVAGGEIVWVPGARRAYAGWVSGDTTRYLVISAQRERRWTPVES